MSKQPLAFTLVKTVVTARDEGRELLPAYQTAWALLCDEMAEDARQLSGAVKWGPEYQTELRTVIDGVRACLGTDPALEQEFSAFVSDYTLFAEQQLETSFPPTTPTTQSSSVSPGLSLQDSAAAEGVSFRHADLSSTVIAVAPPTRLNEDEQGVVIADNTPTPYAPATEYIAVTSIGNDDLSNTTALDDVQIESYAPVEAEAVVADNSEQVNVENPVEEITPPPSSPRAEIPMIVLEPELLADLDDVGVDSPVAANAKQPVYYAPLTVQEPEVAPTRPVLVSGAPLQSEIPPPAIPIFPDATRGQTGAVALDANTAVEPQSAVRWLPWLGIGLLAFGLVALGVYYLTRTPAMPENNTAEQDGSPATTPAVPEAAAIALPIAPEALTFSEMGQWDQARDAQRTYIDDLELANASTGVRADALATLARYASSAGDLPTAVQAQKNSLELAKQAYGDNSTAAGDAHLDLADYYIQTEELHMARAHLLQGRHLIEQHPADANAERLAHLQALSGQLE